jgi:intracellular septation protein A
MQVALAHLFSDFLSTILFLIVFGLTGNLYLSVAIGVGTGLLRIGILKLRDKPIEPMQWMALGLVLVFGTASLITNDGRLLMAKPSISSLAIGLVMLRRGWMFRYLPQVARDTLPKVIIDRAGYAWAALMMTLAVLNLVVATTFDFQTWAWFASFGVIGAKVGAFTVTYVIFRAIVNRKLDPAPARW